MDSFQLNYDRDEKLSISMLNTTEANSYHQSSSGIVKTEIVQPNHLPQVKENLDHMAALLDQHSFAQSAFLHHKGTFTQTIYRKGIWRAGWDAIAEYYGSQDSKGEEWMRKLCDWTSLIVDRVSSTLNISCTPRLSSQEIMAKFSQTHNWSNSVVKAIAWHPNVVKLAVGYSDHTVRLYSTISPINPLLKHASQKHITCVAWQKFSSSTLAVGCENGIIIWQVDPQLLSARPSGSAVQVLPYPSSSPLTSLDWSPDGLLLLSASAAETNILVWNVPQERYESLDRKQGIGNVKASWSPEGSRVMCTTQTNVVRLWNTSTWECEKWSSDAQGRWLASAWSPDGSVLLFCSESAPVVYALCFPCKGQGHTTSTAKQVVDLMECLPASLVERFDGWYIRDLVWDRTATNLVLLVTAGEELTSHLIFFSSRLKLTLEVSFRGFLEGSTEKYVTTMAFCNVGEDTVLTVAWLDGEITHIPMNSLRGTLISAPRHDQTTQLFSTTLS